MYLRLFLFMFVLSTAGCAATADTERRDADGSEPVNFQELERRESPNDYLVCPDGFCKMAKPDRIAPILQIPAADLKKRAEDHLAGLPRTEVVFASETRIVAEQRSLIFKFPDTIDMAIIPVDRGTSTVAIYSRSRYGYYDFGANKRRVESWLDALAAPTD